MNKEKEIENPLEQSKKAERQKKKKKKAKLM